MRFATRPFLLRGALDWGHRSGAGWAALGGQLPESAAAQRRRSRATASATKPSVATPASGADGEVRQRWDITPERWVQVNYEQADYDRFPGERAAFRAEPRLKPESFPRVAVTAEEMDWSTVMCGLVSFLRLGDVYTTRFQELLMERLSNNHSLMEYFDIPAVEDKEIVYVPHDRSVPTEGAYQQLRMQAYWLALHVWLLHSKQHAVQEGEGLFGSALCALLTRRLFEWQWDRIRILLHATKVPVMSITSELQDLQEFIFGLCVALDDAFREEGALGSLGTAGALACTEEELQPGQLGLAPRVKHVLWSNMYSGAVPHGAAHLCELTVYLLRQRMALEALPRGTFFMGQFTWAEFSRHTILSE